MIARFADDMSLTVEKDRLADAKIPGTGLASVRLSDNELPEVLGRRSCGDVLLAHNGQGVFHQEPQRIGLASGRYGRS